MADFDPARDPRSGGPAATKNEAVLARIREDTRLNALVWGPAYRAAEQDQAFLAGHQWDPVDEAMRKRAGRVTLTINDLGQFLDQIVGDLRMNPTQIQVRAADFVASSAQFVSTTGRKYSAADVRAGLLREIEYQSLAPLHYALAGQHAAETGLGFLRAYYDYEDDNSFCQQIRVERIKNRWSVWCDAMATEPDWSDQDNAQIGTWMKLTEFRKKYPDLSMASILQDDRGFWNRDGFVRIAECYWREDMTVQLLQLDNGNVIRSDDEKGFELARVSGRVVNQRKAKTKKVRHCLAVYNAVLGDINDIPGPTIPVVPVIGKRLEGAEDDLVYGIVRFAKDPKRMENYWLSSATERISLMPSAPWVVTANMIKGFENEWAQANTGLKAYLPYNPDPEAATLKPERPQPAQIPAGEMQLILAFGDKVKATTGFHDAGIGKARNEQSGVAIERLQHESDVGAYVFSANTQVAVARVGKIMNDWIGPIYDSERYITIRHENGEVDVLEINAVGEDGLLMNDLTAGRFDIHVEAGPSFSTLRQQSAETMLELVKADPQGSIAYKDIMFENMDFPGHDRVAARVRKMVPHALLDPAEMTEEERNAPPTPPTPEQLLEAHKADAEMATADAKIDTARATKATAAATIATAESTMVGLIAGSPEQAQTNFEAKQTVDKAKQAEKAKAGGAIDPQMEEALRELILNLLAEATAAGSTPGAPPNGGQRPAAAGQAALPAPAAGA